MWFHSYDSLHDRLAGFPDLVIAGFGGVLFAELKDYGAQLSSPQNRWHWSLVAAGADWVLWRPADIISGEVDRKLDELTGES